MDVFKYFSRVVHKLTTQIKTKNNNKKEYNSEVLKIILSLYSTKLIEIYIFFLFSV